MESRFSLRKIKYTYGFKKKSLQPDHKIQNQGIKGSMQYTFFKRKIKSSLVPNDDLDKQSMNPIIFRLCPCLKIGQKARSLHPFVRLKFPTKFHPNSSTFRVMVVTLSKNFQTTVIGKGINEALPVVGKQIAQVQKVS